MTELVTYITVPDAAIVLGVAENTVRRMASRGRLTGIWLPSSSHSGLPLHCRFNLKEVESLHRQLERIRQVRDARADRYAMRQKLFEDTRTNNESPDAT